MTYEQDKALRRLRRKIEVLSDLYEHADNSRRGEIESDIRRAESDITRIYEAQWKPGFVTQGVSDGNHR